MHLQALTLCNATIIEVCIRAIDQVGVVGTQEVLGIELVCVVHRAS